MNWQLFVPKPMKFVFYSNCFNMDIDRYEYSNSMYCWFKFTETKSSIGTLRSTITHVLSGDSFKFGLFILILQLIQESSLVKFHDVRHMCFSVSYSVSHMLMYSIPQRLRPSLQSCPQGLHVQKCQHALVLFKHRFTYYLHSCCVIL